MNTELNIFQEEDVMNRSVKCKHRENGLEVSRVLFLVNYANRRHSLFSFIVAFVNKTGNFVLNSTMNIGSNINKFVSRSSPRSKILAKNCPTTSERNRGRGPRAKKILPFEREREREDRRKQRSVHRGWGSDGVKIVAFPSIEWTHTCRTFIQERQVIALQIQFVIKWSNAESSYTRSWETSIIDGMGGTSDRQQTILRMREKHHFGHLALQSRMKTLFQPHDKSIQTDCGDYFVDESPFESRDARNGRKVRFV